MTRVKLKEGGAGVSGVVFWLCLVNTILIIMHEIDAAYWKEWKLFRALSEWKPFRLWDEANEEAMLAIFLLAHTPLLFILLYGLTALAGGEGTVYSLFFSILLIIHYFVHAFVAGKGRSEFRLPVSRMILAGTLVFSVLQLGLTAFILFSI